MKKLTTTMMQETLNKQDRHLTVVLDLGDRSSFYCVLDEAGEVLLEQKVSTTPKAIKEFFEAIPRSRIALETGTHSPWMSRLLSELGHETIVAHARSVRLIGESRRKDDRLPALSVFHQPRSRSPGRALPKSKTRPSGASENVDLW